MEFMMEKRISGFKLYDLGPYPMVIKTSDENDFVTFDIFQVTARTKEMIDAMEFGAGYIDIHQPITNEIMATVYAYPRIPHNAIHIKSGDYVQYIRQDKKQASVASAVTENDSE